MTRTWGGENLNPFCNLLTSFLIRHKHTKKRHWKTNAFRLVPATKPTRLADGFGHARSALLASQTSTLCHEEAKFTPIDRFPRFQY
ncbi:hypothetical protein D3C73_655670 [compost metagenome]